MGEVQKGEQGEPQKIDQTKEGKDGLLLENTKFKIEVEANPFAKKVLQSERYRNKMRMCRVYDLGIPEGVNQQLSKEDQLYLEYKRRIFDHLINDKALDLTNYKAELSKEDDWNEELFERASQEVREELRERTLSVNTEEENKKLMEEMQSPEFLERHPEKDKDLLDKSIEVINRIGRVNRYKANIYRQLFLVKKVHFLN